MEKVIKSELLNEIEALLGQYRPSFEEQPDIPLSNMFSKLQNIAASQNALTLKPIGDLLALNFFVDDYQRGYKWLPQQVEALLNDIHEFSPGKSGFYCLQPVVVKYHEASDRNNRQACWELIDGQQRITTLGMIMRYLGSPVYSIDYKTRTSSTTFIEQFLEGTLDYEDWDAFLCSQDLEHNYRSSDLDNVDNYHFFRAYRVIHDWFNSSDRFEDESSRSEWLDKLLNHTRVIWYAARSLNEAVGKQQSIDIFMRINSGKIPLTNAELLKALFIHHISNTHDPLLASMQQAELSQQWDDIERGLQENSFWAFLQDATKASPANATRIELLFDLVSGQFQGRSKKGGEHIDPFFSFNFFSQRIGQSDSAPRQEVLHYWHQIKQGYYRLREWYENDELYHLTGFLISRNIRPIAELWALAEEKSKSNFADELRQIIGSTISGYFRVSGSKELDFTQVQYGGNGDRPKLISLLILFNIDLHRKQGTRLAFNTYKRVQWDLEHVHAQNSKSLTDDKEREAWYADQESIIASEDVPEGLKKQMSDALGKWHSAQQSNELADSLNDLKSHYQKLFDTAFGASKDNESDSLDNLCLLPSSVNRGIGNHIFSVKRQMIIEYEREYAGGGEFFIPVATRLLFSKYFSPSVTQMHKWSQPDRKGYREAMIKCFTSYGLTGDLT
ncbi:Uncharacterised protein [BD1-7 clade bacterium]|uniref:GmrSD restriction endonucleases N-terminal domain-containing protein n=1 Tax=BD1-7 clade bacterium TaxID=2029982 RepID=A0A5S9PAE4_9GAMM|nr:Uncharacterised protein [BD1-7 clade bacterium]CAA0101497.1 Uncharacterised protein [BD1-7 clade bacterium]